MPYFLSTKRVDVHMLSYLLSYSEDDFIKIKKFRKKFVEWVLEVLQKHFSIKLPKNKLYFHQIVNGSILFFNDKKIDRSSPSHNYLKQNKSMGIFPFLLCTFLKVSFPFLWLVHPIEYLGSICFGLNIP